MSFSYRLLLQDAKGNSVAICRGVKHANLLECWSTSQLVLLNHQITWRAVLWGGGNLVGGQLFSLNLAPADLL